MSFSLRSIARSGVTASDTISTSDLNIYNANKLNNYSIEEGKAPENSFLQFVNGEWKFSSGGSGSGGATGPQGPTGPQGNQGP